MSWLMDEYQAEAATHNVTDGVGAFADGMSHLALMGLGLSGEAGEASDAIKKAWRDDGHVAPWRRKVIAKELGDCLWYIAIIAQSLGYRLSEIAQINADKLADRRDRGVIQGHGDER